MGNQAGYNDRVIENVWAGRLGEIQTIQMWGGGGAGRNPLSVQAARTYCLMTVSRRDKRPSTHVVVGLSITIRTPTCGAGARLRTPAGSVQ